MSNINPSITYQLEGSYSYQYEENEVEYDRYLGNQHIEEFIEHAFQIVTPYQRVRITIEVI